MPANASCQSSLLLSFKPPSIMPPRHMKENIAPPAHGGSVVVIDPEGAKLATQAKPRA
jgi:hypothetical protein